MASPEEMRNTIAFLCDAPEATFSGEPEPINLGIPLMQSRNGPVITSFPTDSHEETEASDSEDVDDSTNGVMNTDCLQLEIQRFCCDFSNESIEENYANLSLSNGPPEVVKKGSTNWGKMLMDLRNQYDDVEASSTPGPTLNNLSPKEETHTKDEQVVTSDKKEDSEDRLHTAKSRRRKLKRGEKCNNAAIQSILKIVTPASAMYGSRLEENVAASATLPNGSEAIPDGQKLWKSSVGRFPLNESLITSASLHSYDHDPDFVPKEYDSPVFSPDAFPPL